MKKEARSIEHFFDELKKSENQALLEPVVRACDLDVNFSDKKKRVHGRNRIRVAHWSRSLCRIRGCIGERNGKSNKSYARSFVVAVSHEERFA